MQDTFKKSIKPLAVEEFLDYFFYRRLAAFLVPTLIRMNLTPNQITTLSLVFGLIATFCIFKFWFVWAALMTIVCIVLDCCDGQVARLTGKTHPLGRVLDGFFDAVWMAAMWSTLYFCGYFQMWNISVAWLMPLAGASTLIHCWRFDAVKVHYLEYTEAHYHEGDLDVSSAAKLMKSEWKAGRYFWACLALGIMFQMYFFVRGSGKKQKYNFSERQRVIVRQKMDPIVSHWSYLGQGHHNTLVIFGLLLAPWTPDGFLSAFWMISVPMNLMWLFCEFRFSAVKRSLATGQGFGYEPTAFEA